MARRGVQTPGLPQSPGRLRAQSQAGKAQKGCRIGHRCPRSVWPGPGVNLGLSPPLPLHLAWAGQEQVSARLNTPKNKSSLWVPFWDPRCPSATEGSVLPAAQESDATHQPCPGARPPLNPLPHHSPPSLRLLVLPPPQWAVPSACQHTKPPKPNQTKPNPLGPIPGWPARP